MTDEFHSEAWDEVTIPTAGHQGAPPARVDPATQHSTAALAPAQLPTDALVSFQAGLVFATTGQVACNELGAELNQVALTPAVAWRIAAALREMLEYGGIEARRGILSLWHTHEVQAIPHGRILLDERAVQVGIEPLGAGVFVTVGWAFVPGFILALEGACGWAQSVR